MFGSNEVLVPNSGRPVVVSFPALMLPFAVLKFARFAMLNNCAISSRAYAVQLGFRPRAFRQQHRLPGVALR